jgi:hypothetical protein
MSKKIAYNSTFRPDDRDFSLNACLGYSPNEFGTIARGFQSAANNLVAHVSDHESDLDGMVYPIAFLYRHAVETTLKIAIVATGTEMTNEPNHLLLSIWDRIQPNVSRHFALDPSYVDLAAVRESLKDFELVDPRSFAFRYPTSKNGEAQLPGMAIINIRVLSDRANWLIHQLDRIVNAFG